MTTNNKGFGLVGFVLVLAVFILLGSVGYYVYSANKAGNETEKESASGAKSATKAINTECFSFSVPDTYKVEFNDNKCQASAFLGPSIKEASLFVVILPYTSELANLQEAEDKLVGGLKNIHKADGQEKVGGYDAVYLKGPSIVKGVEKYSAQYVVLSPESYSPTGSDYSTNAFRVGSGAPKDGADMIQDIIDSVTWK